MNLSNTEHIKPAADQIKSKDYKISEPPGGVKWLTGMLAALCLIGIGVSAELTRIHILVHTDPDYHSVCAMSEWVNCETVAISPYSVFAGLPVSVWGTGGYVIMFVLALWGLSRKRIHTAWPIGFLMILSTFSLMVSVALAYISVTKIDSVCLFCISSYVINFLLFVLCIVAVKRSNSVFGKLLMSDILGLSQRPVMMFSLLLAGIFLFAVLKIFIPQYWKMPGWSDLPALTHGEDAEGHHWIGAEKPVIKIVEFSDYECPHCRGAHKEIRLLASKHPQSIQLIHRHFPLDMKCNYQLKRPFHLRACSFAKAAECAGIQDKFWEMNDAIFSIQDTIKTEDVNLEEIAVRLRLNSFKFKECMKSETLENRIKNDIDAAVAYKLRGTPGFIIDGEVFVGRIPENKIEQLLK
ncbi:MAG: thioredoxin domain-containing protein [Deltaproteobacteria bacterium]|nr:thioredoxin domain-containing protein [Deltaproteobacteria bacterium]